MACGEHCVIRSTTVCAKCPLPQELQSHRVAAERVRADTLYQGRAGFEAGVSQYPRRARNIDRRIRLTECCHPGQSTL